MHPVPRRFLWCIAWSPWIHGALASLVAMANLRAGALLLWVGFPFLGAVALLALTVMFQFRNELRAREQIAMILVGGLGGLLDVVIGGLSLLVMMD